MDRSQLHTRKKEEHHQRNKGILPSLRFEPTSPSLTPATLGQSPAHQAPNERSHDASPRTPDQSSPPLPPVISSSGYQLGERTSTQQPGTVLRASACVAYK